MASLDLREAWSDLLRRRGTLADSLRPYGEALDLWATAPVDIAPLGWPAAECRRRWERGVPLLAEAPPALEPEALERILGPLMELVATAIGSPVAAGLAAFAEAWDAHQIAPADLFPGQGRIGSVDERLAVEPDLVAFIALGTLRPWLQAYFARCHGQLGDGEWFLGVCPFCGAPPGFSDLVEDGRRRLACHLCGGAWIVPRLACPFCGADDTKDAVRLEPQGTDQGYLIAACRRCQAYLKELDRRVRWNGGPGLVEDWGSPHFDLVARRSGYWRAVPTLLSLTQRS